jgi:hypothetical protein
MCNNTNTTPAGGKIKRKEKIKKITKNIFKNQDV